MMMMIALRAVAHVPGGRSSVLQWSDEAITAEAAFEQKHSDASNNDVKIFSKFLKDKFKQQPIVSGLFKKSFSKDERE